MEDARAAQIAQGINESRPEGVPSTLPDPNHQPEDHKLGPSNVNSHSGIPYPPHTPSPEA
ncbi:MAG: hypothetical protein ABIP50_03790 [Candidatus Saccharimonadales bacterium]